VARLKRDERICPYCAETIKAAATKCRYCQSELTPLVETGPEAQPLRQTEPQPVTESVTEPEAPTEPDAPTEADSVDAKTPDASEQATVSFQAGLAFVQRRLTLVLAVLVVLAATAVGVSWYQAEQGSSAVAPSGALVGDDARTQALVAAADLTQRTLSYDYKTLANDMEVARARMTPSFLKEYNGTMAQVRPNTEKNKIVLEAVVVSSAIIKATEHQATVLVFVNQTTTAGDGKDRNQQLSRNSLVVTLARGEGDWDMSKLTALG
jgi:Mce-associated membrane protein